MKKMTLLHFSMIYLTVVIIAIVVVAIIVDKSNEPPKTFIESIGEAAREVKEEFDKGYHAVDSVKKDSITKQ